MKKLRAFSLFEAVLVIAILGVTVSCVLPILHSINYAKKVHVNEAKFMYVRKAMSGYLMRHGFLPNAAVNDNGIGQAGCCKGYVPYKTLGIPKKYITDSDAKPFTYVVNALLVKQEGKTHLPITIPTTTVIAPGQITFCRLYKHEGAAIVAYDSMCTENALVLLENGESVVQENDAIYIMQPVIKFSSLDALQTWQELSVKSRKSQYKSCNAIAWLLISHGKVKSDMQVSKAKIANKEGMQTFYLNKDKNDKGVFNDQVFYQTRFEMMQDLNIPCSTEPIYGEKLPKT